MAHRPRSVCDTGCMPAKSFNPTLHPRRHDGRFKRTPAADFPQRGSFSLTERPAMEPGGLGDPLNAEEEAELCGRLMLVVADRGCSVGDALDIVADDAGKWGAASFTLASMNLYGGSSQAPALLRSSPGESAVDKVRAAAALADKDAGRHCVQRAVMKRSLDDLSEEAESGQLSRDMAIFIIRRAAWRFLRDNEHVTSDMLSPIGPDDSGQQAPAALFSRYQDARNRIAAEPW